MWNNILAITQAGYAAMLQCNASARETEDVEPLDYPHDGPVREAIKNNLPISVPRKGVAMVSIAGPMQKWDSWYGTNTRAAEVAVKAAAIDSSIRGIVLRMDTPGGSVDGLAELGDTIFSARQSKQIVAHVTGMAASAGYYAASQAHAIYAGRMDLVGSLGTWMALYDYSEAFDKAGIKAIPISTSELKTTGLMGAPVTDAQKAELQKIVDAYGEDFKAVIARGRGIDSAKVDSMFTGEIWQAKEALGNGLIDGIQNIETTLAMFDQQSFDGKKASMLAQIDIALDQLEN